jgi:hypothetical protein
VKTLPFIKWDLTKKDAQWNRISWHNKKSTLSSTMKTQKLYWWSHCIDHPTHVNKFMNNVLKELQIHNSNLNGKIVQQRKHSTVQTWNWKRYKMLSIHPHLLLWINQKSNLLLTTVNNEQNPYQAVMQNRTWEEVFMHQPITHCTKLNVYEYVSKRLRTGCCCLEVRELLTTNLDM